MCCVTLYSTDLLSSDIAFFHCNACADKLASMVSQLSREAEPLESYNSFKRPLSIGGGISHYENYNVEELFAEEFNPQIEPASPTSRDDAPYCLVWKNLSLTLKNGGTNVIDNVSGAVPAGTVLALMGPSGAGKTSLLNALGNRAPHGTVTGEITFGKTDFMKEDLYFVSHFDDLNGNLTVYEQMELVGLLRWVDGDDMYLHLDVILHTLGLFDKARMYCSELTRGELKKVSVGMGMISRPKVLFLDEPISGLDSSAAYSIVQHLADLAGCLKTAVIMTIHQPAEMVFDMLQDLYILEGGRLAYAGPMSCCEKYFKTLGYKCPFKTDVADFVMDILNKPPLVLHQSSWQTLYRNSKFCDNVTQEHLALDNASRVYPTNTFQPSDSAHLRLFFTFFFKYYCRDYWFYYHRILCLTAIALFSGTLFLNSTPESQNFVQYSGAIFFNMWTALFSAVAATGNLASDRRQAVEQIKNSVIKPSLYYFAQFMISLPFNFVTALIFQSVYHWLTNINPNKESFIYSVLLTCGHLLLMESYTLLVVEVLKNAMLCVTFSMIIMGWLFLFAGFFIKVSDMPAWIRWVCYVTPTKYSFDGYLYQIFHSQEFAVSSSSTTSFMSGNFVLKEHFSQSGVRPWAMYGTLLAWIALIRLIHYGTHYYQMREFRSRNKSGPLGNLAPLMEKAALEDPSIA
jgi:ABC-type multidrug transport system ATPase subunit/ABC-type multidrug transport system permease subunit